MGLSLQPLEVDSPLCILAQATASHQLWQGLRHELQPKCYLFTLPTHLMHIDAFLFPWTHPSQDSLLSEVELKLQQWQAGCERLRTAHAAALTEGI